MTFKSVLWALVALVFTAGVAAANCERNGGKWAGPSQKLSIYHPDDRWENFTTTFRICRLQNNDDLLRIYLVVNEQGQIRPIGYTRNVGHERVGGRRGLTQQIMFPFKNFGWTKVPFIVQLAEYNNGWRITAIDPILGKNRKRVVRELTKPINRMAGFS